MRIKEIIIYGFGKFANVHLAPFSSYQVIFGENEAGKSTIMAFIHAILFGFPTKQQSELRYEPKNDARYGGKLLIEVSEFGNVTIERIKGKATGDVSVTLENGTVGGNELLEKILNNIDKRMYQSIFSFNVHGLQGVGKMKGEDISQYLLAAGIFGTDTLLNMEQYLDKELEAMFKPNGRKPELNQLLDRLKEKDLELKKGKKQNDSYHLLQQKAWNIQSDIKKLQEQLHINQQQIQTINQYIQEWPLYEEKKQLEERLQELGTISFPIDGINRLVHLEDQLRTASSYLKTVQERKKIFDAQLETVQPDPQIIENGLQIQLVVEQWSQAQEWQEQLQQLQFEMDKAEDQIRRLKQDIHYSDEDIAELARLDIGIGMKENVRKATKDYFYLRSRENDLVKQEEQEKSNLYDIELKINGIEQRLISEEEFRALSENQKQYKKMQQQMVEHQHIQEQLQAIRLASGNHQVKAKGVSSFVMIFIFIAIMIYSFISKQTLLAVGTIIGVIFLLVAYWIDKRKRGASSVDISRLLDKEKVLSKEIADVQKYPDKSSLFDEQVKLRQEWKELMLRLEMQQVQYDRIKAEIDSWREAWNENEKKLLNIKKQLRVQLLMPEQLLDAYERLLELVKLLQEKEAKYKNWRLVKKKYDEWSMEVERLTQLVSDQTLSINDSIMILKNEWSRTREKQIEYDGLLAKINEQTQEELKWANDKEILGSELGELLKEAMAETTNDFRDTAKKYEEAMALQKSLGILEKRLNHSRHQDIESVQSIEVLKAQYEKLLEKNESNSAELNHLHKELAEVTYEISVLEEGGTYTEKLHEFYYLKDQFNRKAKEWMKISIAKQILKMTTDRLNKERFPKVMEKAQEYLRTLTNEEYLFIHIQEEGKFVVERKDRMIFLPAELSQATAEQLYVSIRFALVHVLKQDYPFPIIIDDSFVNFDKKRTLRVLKLLKEISQSTQVLFFTCHQHLLQEFSSEEIVDLAANSSQYANEMIG